MVWTMRMLTYDGKEMQNSVLVFDRESVFDGRWQAAQRLRKARNCLRQYVREYNVRMRFLEERIRAKKEKQ